jgi:hypothetical protein
MIPKNTIKILNLLLRSTDKHGFNINQIAKSLNISVGSAFKILKYLEEKFFVVPEKISNAKHYFLNFNNEPVIKLCEFLLLNERNSLNKHAKLYSETIQEFVGAELIIMFGSILKKKGIQ